MKNFIVFRMLCRLRETLTRPVLCIGLFSAFFSAALVFWSPGFLEPLDATYYDALLRFTADEQQHPDIVLVKIDEESLERFGQWPWPRYLLSSLLEKIAEANPAVVGVDLLLAEIDRMSLRIVRQTLQQEFGVDVSLKGLTPEAVDNDLLLAQALDNAPFYLGNIFFFNEASFPRKKLPQPPFTIAGNGAGFLFSATDTLLPIPVLAEAATGLGFLNVLPDFDGVIRKSPLVMEYDSQLYPSLGLALATQYLGIESFSLEMEKKRTGRIFLGGQTVLLDKNGCLNIRYPKESGGYHSLSALQVMTGQVSGDFFRNRIVLVGFSAKGLEDSHTTSLGVRSNGAEIQAAIVDTILSGKYIVTPSWGNLLRAFLLFSAIFFSLLIISRCSALVISLVCLGLLVSIPLAGYLLFHYFGIFLPGLSDMLLYVLSFIIFSLVHFRSEEMQLREYERQLARAQEMTIIGLASVVETRDSYTGHHIIRIRRYVKVLAEYFSVHGGLGYRLSIREVELFYKSSVLHDVGKVGVPDHILLKPGALTYLEFEEMKKHTLYGSETFEKAGYFSEEVAGLDFLKVARDIALSHHEKWDGSGYPYGLKGEDIPFCGRVMAVADVYDALVSRRPYKEGMSHVQARKYIIEGRASHFDPQVVDAFLACEQEFQEIARQFDAEEPVPDRDLPPEASMERIHKVL